MFEDGIPVPASNAGADDRFGFAIAVSGGTFVVGAPHEDSASTGVKGDQASDTAPSSGAVYVYTRVNGAWVQQAYLKAASAEVGDQFGYSVAISGET